MIKRSAALLLNFALSCVLLGAVEAQASTLEEKFDACLEAQNEDYVVARNVLLKDPSALGFLEEKAKSKDWKTGFLAEAMIGRYYEELLVLKIEHAKQLHAWSIYHMEVMAKTEDKLIHRKEPVPLLRELLLKGGIVSVKTKKLPDAASETRYTAEEISHISGLTLKTVQTWLFPDQINASKYKTISFGECKARLPHSPLVSPSVHARYFGSDLYQIYAAVRLGYLKDEASLPALISLMESYSPSDTRDFAARGLGLMGNPKAVNSLLNAFYKDKPIKYTALHSLSMLDEKSTVAPYISILQNDTQHALVAIKALAEIDDPRAVDALIKALTYEDQSIRRETAEALGKIKDKQAVMPLSLLVKDKDRDVRMAAVQALGEMKDKRAVPPLLSVFEEPSMCVAVMLALGEIKDTRAVIPISTLVKVPNDYVRLVAVQTLGKIQDKTTLPALLQYITDKDPKVRCAAVDALVAISDLRAVDALFDATEDEVHEVSVKAIDALTKLLKPIAPAGNMAEWHKWWDQHRGEYINGE